VQGLGSGKAASCGSSAMSGEWHLADQRDGASIGVDRAAILACCSPKKKAQQEAGLKSIFLNSLYQDCDPYQSSISFLA